LPQASSYYSGQQGTFDFHPGVGEKEVEEGENQPGGEVGGEDEEVSVGEEGGEEFLEEGGVLQGDGEGDSAGEENRSDDYQGDVFAYFFPPGSAFFYSPDFVEDSFYQGDNPHGNEEGKDYSQGSQGGGIGIFYVGEELVEDLLHAPGYLFQD